MLADKNHPVFFCFFLSFFFDNCIYKNTIFTKTKQKHRKKKAKRKNNIKSCAAPTSISGSLS